MAGTNETEESATDKPIDAGTAGSSARREHERRSSRREERIRTAHPKLGGLILALSSDPQSTRAWAHGRHRVLWPKKLVSVLSEPGPLQEGDVAALQVRLARCFPNR
jgi:hypothetical protein